MWVMPFTYCVCDVETDGPIPGVHALRSLAIAAFDEAGDEISAYQATVEPLPGTHPDEATMAWWATEPVAWAATTKDPRPAEVVLPELMAWLDALPRPRVFVAHPLLFDGPWLDAYLQRFTTQRLFAIRPNESPFDGPGIDIPTFVRATFDLPYRAGPPIYPDSLRHGAPHDHTPLTDARGHARTFFSARAAAGDPIVRNRIREDILRAEAQSGQSP